MCYRASGTVRHQQAQVWGVAGTKCQLAPLVYSCSTRHKHLRGLWLYILFETTRFRINNRRSLSVAPLLCHSFLGPWRAGGGPSTRSSLFGSSAVPRVARKGSGCGRQTRERGRGLGGGVYSETTEVCSTGQGRARHLLVRLDIASASVRAIRSAHSAPGFRVTGH